MLGALLYNVGMIRHFQHYKNKMYRYVGVAKHSETLGDLVVYETLYENPLGRLWVRPREMFFGEISPGVARFRELKTDFREFRSVGDAEIALFKPIVDEVFGEWDSGKLAGRQVFLVIAGVDGEVAGFKIGYADNEPGVFYSWLGGVKPKFRGYGLGEEMMKRQHAYCGTEGYRRIRTKSENPFKAMLRLNLKMGFDIVGTEEGPRGLKIVMEKKI